MILRKEDIFARGGKKKNIFRLSVYHSILLNDNDITGISERKADDSRAHAWSSRK